VKFLRHLATVVVVVAVIVGLGIAWAHASGGGTGPGPGSSTVIRQAPSGEALPRLRQVKGSVIMARPGTDYLPSGFRLTGFDLTNTSILIQTCVIEALLASVVITVSAVRRRHRRSRRRAGQYRLESP
jgi:hypothetical protein